MALRCSQVTSLQHGVMASLGDGITNQIQVMAPSDPCSSFRSVVLSVCFFTLVPRQEVLLSLLQPDHVVLSVAAILCHCNVHPIFLVLMMLGLIADLGQELLFFLDTSGGDQAERRSGCKCREGSILVGIRMKFPDSCSKPKLEQL